MRDTLKLRESAGGDIPLEFGELLVAGANLFIGPLLQHLVTPEGIAELLQGAGT